ncbi:MAG: hypothetical protein Q7T70_01725 [Polaromonas sp.]|nr:hypothetical protein [Polaromonas sp.]
MFPSLVPALSRLPALLLLTGLAAAAAHAQSSCSSDGQPAPATLLERFINADCANCWTDVRTARPTGRELALDWVLPGSLGDNAPLSAVATRDGVQRLEALEAMPPAATLHRKAPVQSRQGTLRVAHGLPVSGYIGASIQLRRPPVGATSLPWTAWLALVETLPSGTEGSPVARNLVRNTIQPIWDKGQQLSKGEQVHFRESRVMDIPPGANPERLAVIGWVQDSEGRILAAAQSRCIKPR